MSFQNSDLPFTENNSRHSQQSMTLSNYNIQNRLSSFIIHFLWFKPGACNILKYRYCCINDVQVNVRDISPKNVLTITHPLYRLNHIIAILTKAGMYSWGWKNGNMPAIYTNVNLGDVECIFRAVHNAWSSFFTLIKLHDRYNGFTEQLHLFFWLWVCGLWTGHDPVFRTPVVFTCYCHPHLHQSGGAWMENSCKHSNNDFSDILKLLQPVFLYPLSECVQ